MRMLKVVHACGSALGVTHLHGGGQRVAGEGIAQDARQVVAGRAKEIRRQRGGALRARERRLVQLQGLHREAESESQLRHARLHARHLQQIWQRILLTCAMRKTVEALLALQTRRLNGVLLARNPSYYVSSTCCAPCGRGPEPHQAQARWRQWQRWPARLRRPAGHGRTPRAPGSRRWSRHRAQKLSASCSYGTASKACHGCVMTGRVSPGMLLLRAYFPGCMQRGNSC